MGSLTYSSDNLRDTRYLYSLLSNFVSLAAKIVSKGVGFFWKTKALSTKSLVCHCFQLTWYNEVSVVITIICLVQVLCIDNIYHAVD